MTDVLVGYGQERIRAFFLGHTRNKGAYQRRGHAPHPSLEQKKNFRIHETTMRAHDKLLCFQPRDPAKNSS